MSRLGRGRTLADHQAHHEGRQIARANGARMGRKPKLTPHQIKEARRRLAKSYSVSVSTISRLHNAV